jgi:hypothetical protein
VVRFKDGVGYRILERFAVAPAPTTAGFRLTSDWTIRLPGWEGVVLRLVSYQLPEGNLAEGSGRLKVGSDAFSSAARAVGRNRP